MANQTRGNGVRKLAAVIMVGSLIGIVALASGQFLSWFKDTKTVTLQAPRAGLVMNPDAKVKLRGVTVGRVASVSTTGERAELVLDIDADQISKIPGNVQADIKSNTVFGAKNVNLFVPPSGPQGTLAPGDEITADHVVVELNTVYQQLVNVLAQVEPERMNVVLGAVNDALSGRGEKLGTAIVQLNDILGKTNRNLPALNEMLSQAAGAMNVYADAVPNLLRTVDNATVVGDTLVDKATNLDRLLINVTGMARAGNGVLSASKTNVMSTLSDMAPVTALLGYQAPGLRCFITSASDAADVGNDLIGGRSKMLLLDAGLAPGKEPYSYPNSLPEVRGDGPPTCDGVLSDVASMKKPDFYVIDNAQWPYQPRTTPKVEATKLFRFLFGGTPRG